MEFKIHFLPPPGPPRHPCFPSWGWPCGQSPGPPVLLLEGAPRGVSSAVPGLILAFHPIFCSYWAWKKVFNLLS